MLVDHGSQILTCTDGCSTSAGSIFRLILSSGSEDVTRLFFRRPWWFCACSAMCGGYGTLWMITSKVLNRKMVQVMAGRWVFALQFRRPAMSVLDRTWRFVGGNLRMGTDMRAQW